MNLLVSLSFEKMEFIRAFSFGWVSQYRTCRLIEIMQSRFLSEGIFDAGVGHVNEIEIFANHE